MKPFLALVAGFVLSLGMFIMGAGFASWLLMAEPVQEVGPSTELAGLWTAQPRKVDTAAQQLERLPAQATPQDHARSAANRPERSETAVARDVVVPNGEEAPITGSVRRVGEQAVPALFPAHVEWCFNRYRSYRVSDDSYAPYSGGREPCVSPYSEEMEAEAVPPSAAESVVYAEEAADVSSASVEWASADSSFDGAMPPEHVADCFSRYRSYRPEDNTYQPYGGGPRRQCR